MNEEQQVSSIITGVMEPPEIHLKTESWTHNKIHTPYHLNTHHHHRLNNQRLCIGTMTRDLLSKKTSTGLIFVFLSPQGSQTKSWTPRRRCGSRCSRTCARTRAAWPPTRGRRSRWPARACAEPRPWATVASNKTSEGKEENPAWTDNRPRRESASAVVHDGAAEGTVMKKTWLEMVWKCSNKKRLRMIWSLPCFFSSLSLKYKSADLVNGCSIHLCLHFNLSSLSLSVLN